MIHVQNELLAARTHAARDERGATAIEYSMIAAFIAALIVTTVAFVGLDVAGCFEAFRSAFADALSA